MQLPSESIIHTVNLGDRPLNILTGTTHEAYQYNWRKMKHKFFLMQPDGWVKWKLSHRPVPENHTIIDADFNKLTKLEPIDLILSQNKFGQFQGLKPLAEKLNCPLISLEHTLPLPHWSINERKLIMDTRGQVNVFISEYSCNQWKFSLDDNDTEVIYHGIDTDIFKPSYSEKDGKIMTVVNDWINRDSVCGWSIYERISKNLPINPFGETAGFSKAAKDINELSENYSRCGVFLNTSTISPIPTSLLEAMSCGAPVVSTATCMIPEIIEDGVNGFCSNDEEYLREKLEWCLDNPNEAADIGKQGRKTIEEKFTLSKHIERWEKLFKDVIDGKYN